MQSTASSIANRSTDQADQNAHTDIVPAWVRRHSAVYGKTHPIASVCQETNQFMNKRPDAMDIFRDVVKWEVPVAAMLRDDVGPVFLRDWFVLSKETRKQAADSVSESGRSRDDVVALCNASTAIEFAIRVDDVDLYNEWKMFAESFAGWQPVPCNMLCTMVEHNAKGCAMQAVDLIDYRTSHEYIMSMIHRAVSRGAIDTVRVVADRCREVGSRAATRSKDMLRHALMVYQDGGDKDMGTTVSRDRALSMFTTLINIYKEEDGGAFRPANIAYELTHHRRLTTESWSVVSWVLTQFQFRYYVNDSCIYNLRRVIALAKKEKQHKFLKQVMADPVIAEAMESFERYN